MGKVVYFTTGTPGNCIVPEDTNDSFEPFHYFGLFDENGKKLFERPFKSLETAKELALAEFPGKSYSVRDLTEEWYIKKALEYRARIKKLKSSFKLSALILDMSRLYYSRTANDWYTVIPFAHKGQKWIYRESAAAEWVERV